MHRPPYQPFYVTTELPKDDMFLIKSQTIQAKPTVHEFEVVKNENKGQFIHTEA